MKKEKFKQDRSRHVNLSKQEKNLQAYFLNATGENAKNTLSKEQDRKLTIFAGICVAFLLVLFTLVYVSFF